MLTMSTFLSLADGRQRHMRSKPCFVWVGSLGDQKRLDFAANSTKSRRNFCTVNQRSERNSWRTLQSSAPRHRIDDLGAKKKPAVV